MLPPIYRRAVVLAMFMSLVVFYPSRPRREPVALERRVLPGIGHKPKTVSPRPQRGGHVPKAPLPLQTRAKTFMAERAANVALAASATTPPAKGRRLAAWANLKASVAKEASHSVEHGVFVKHGINRITLADLHTLHTSETALRDGKVRRKSRGRTSSQHRHLSGYNDSDRKRANEVGGTGDDAAVHKSVEVRQQHQDVTMATIEPGCSFEPVNLPPSVPSGTVQRMNGTLAIIGIARNVGRAKVRHAMRTLTAFGDGVFGGRFQAFFVENDSDDCTGTALKEWEHADPSRVHISSSRLDAAAPRLGNHLERIQRLSGFRNKVLAQMRASAHGPFDYVLAIDLDLLPTWQPETLAQPFARMQRSGGQFDFDMVCANGVMAESDNRYYDAFAFRSKAFPHGPLDVSPYFGAAGYVTKIMRGLRRNKDDPPVAVDSCFAGLAIYRGSLFESCNYSSTDGDCEHVHIHRCMHRKVLATTTTPPSFWMLPAMKVVYDLDEVELKGYGVVQQ